MGKSKKNNTERKRRYKELRELGYSSKEASKLRDLSEKNYLQFVTTKTITPTLRTSTIKGKINFLNFDIAKTNRYVRGYLVTSKVYPLDYLVSVIKALLPPEYRPINFELGFESGYISYSELVIFKKESGEEIYKTYINL